jgi:hypothetical protein
MIIWRDIKSYIGGRRGRNEFIRVGQNRCSLISWRYGSVARRRRRWDVFVSVGVPRDYHGERVEFRDIKTEEYFKDDFIGEVIYWRVEGHDLVDCLAGRTV